MKIISREDTTGTRSADGLPIKNHAVLNDFPQHDDESEAAYLLRYKDHLVREIIGRNPVIETLFRNFDDGTVLVYESDLERSCLLIVQELKKALTGNSDYENQLKLFKDYYAKEMIVYRPEDDGITHINVWSKAKTELGRLLSNFANTPFDHPKYGYFASVEAFWYWLSAGKQNNQIRSLYGYQAKKVGRLLRDEIKEKGQWENLPNFEAEIKKAILCKIEQNPKLAEALKNSILPLTHYYVWGDPPNYRLTIPTEYNWIHGYISLVREWLNGRAPDHKQQH